MWLTASLDIKINKGNQVLHDIPIYIEFLPGDTRTKTNSEGKKWSRVMKAAYGRISKTEGADGDCIDVFVGTALDSDKAYVIDQLNKDGDFDEHKCILGCNSYEEAKELYLSNYPPNWKCGKITMMPIAKFKRWIQTSDKNIPVSN